MNALLRLKPVFCALAVLVFAGCAGETFTPEEAPEMLIIREFAAFYRLGPIQARGPDAALRSNERVKMLRREMGYSYVMLEDGRTGYVANESMVPAPPRPARPAAAAATGTSTAPGPTTSGRRTGGPRYSGPQVNDSPLPEPIPAPALDLNIGPEDVVPLPPTPAGTPAEAPQFRY